MKSERLWSDASVRTLVVSWNEAAESHESVASDAFVIPISSGLPSAAVLPSATSSRLASRNSWESTSSAGRKWESPELTTRTLRSIWRTISSMCLSWMSTPWLR